uniref:Uncharacterized protein n=1 Tax=Anguilla anguilla TaxID=7936 RepID=A0A0E9UN06_ANGAN
MQPFMWFLDRGIARFLRERSFRLRWGHLARRSSYPRSPRCH